MKTQSVCELDMLRAEVRQLQHTVTELENRLAEIETAESEEDAVWGVWPYCWFITGWDSVKERLHSFQDEAKRENLKCYNDRLMSDAHEKLVAESYDRLHLVK